MKILSNGNSINSAGMLKKVNELTFEIRCTARQY